MFDICFQCCYDLDVGWTDCHLCVGDSWITFPDFPSVHWFFSPVHLTHDKILAKGREMDAMLSSS